MCDLSVVAAVHCRTARQGVGTAASAVGPARLLAAAHGVSVRSACFTPVVRCAIAVAEVFAAAGLLSCTLLQPVPQADEKGFFGTTASKPAAAASAGSSTAPSEASTADCLSRGAALPAACFADGLGVVMDQTEAKRRALLNSAREVVNNQVAFNALLYPFGAAAVYEKLRGASNHNLLLPALLGSAAYGFMGAGIPEREKQYLQAANELQCSLAWHGQWLYLDSEIGTADKMTTVDTRTVFSDSNYAAFSTSVVTTRTQDRIGAPPRLDLVIGELTTQRPFIGRERVET